MRTFCP